VNTRGSIELMPKPAKRSLTMVFALRFASVALSPTWDLSELPSWLVNRLENVLATLPISRLVS
jgi:hypothetical protein